MNISLNNRSVLFQHGNKLKSTEEKEERQQKDVPYQLAVVGFD